MESHYAICSLSMMPMRAEPAHRAEMISMLLFSDIFEIEESVDDWHRIRTLHDDYKGWITCRKLTLIDKAYSQKLENEKPVFCAENLMNAGGEGGNVQISFGSRLPLFDGKAFHLGDKPYPYNGKVLPLQTPGSIVATATRYLETPYLWGGRSIFGLDCSGLTQMVYRLCGISLPRDAWQQAEKGMEVPSLGEAKAGDLAFFAEKEKISHVGILTGEGHLIHASGRVRMDRIDDKGIFNGEIGEYTLGVKAVRRYF